MNTKSYTNKKGKPKPQDQLLVSNNIKVGHSLEMRQLFSYLIREFISIRSRQKQVN